MNSRTPIALPVVEADTGGNDSPALTLRFFRAAIIASLIGGILPGVWMLLLQAGAGTFAAAPAPWVQVHARTQVMGFLLCFIMGFGYQAFPRFRGTPLCRPALAAASLPILLVGLAMHAAGDLAKDSWRGGRYLALGGALLELLSVLAFLVVVISTARKATRRVSRSGAASHAGFVASAGTWLLISGFLGLPEAWSQTGRAGADLSRTLWPTILRDLQLHGAVLLMIVGVSQRILPGFLSLPPDTSGRAEKWLTWLNLAVLAEAVGNAWAAQTNAAAAWCLQGAGILVLAAGVFSILLPLGVLSRRAASSTPRPFVRSASIWLGISFLLNALAPLNRILLDRGLSHGLMDAARHAFTMGFAMMTVFGISSMVGPALSLKKRLPRRPLLAACVLLNVAVVLRVGGAVLSDSYPTAYVATGASGLVALAAFFLWAVPLWSCIAGTLPGRKWAPRVGAKPPVNAA